MTAKTSFLTSKPDKPDNPVLRRSGQTRPGRLVPVAAPPGGQRYKTLSLRQTKLDRSSLESLLGTPL